MKDTRIAEHDIQELYAAIGQLRVENDFLKPACRQTEQVTGSWASKFKGSSCSTIHLNDFYTQTM
jgi:hypothetical protein